MITVMEWDRSHQHSCWGWHPLGQRGQQKAAEHCLLQDWRQHCRDSEEARISWKVKRDDARHAIRCALPSRSLPNVMTALLLRIGKKTHCGKRHFASAGACLVAGVGQSSDREANDQWSKAHAQQAPRKPTPRRLERLPVPTPASCSSKGRKKVVGGHACLVARLGSALKKSFGRGSKPFTAHLTTAIPAAVSATCTRTAWMVVLCSLLAPQP